VYRTPAPVAERPAGTRPSLGVTAFAHRRFGEGTHRIDDDFSIRHFTDLTDGYGVTYRPDIAERSGGNSFTSMATELLGALAPLPGPVGLAVVGHTTPDVDCRYAAATYLSEVLPGGPLCFAVSDSGRCTPFATLRLAGDYADRHGHEYVLVLLADQATLPYETGAPPENDPVGDAAVALLLGRGDPAGDAGGHIVRHVAGVAETDLASVLRQQCASLPVPVTVLAGPGVDPERHLPPRGARIERVPAGYPCTGLLGALAELPADGRDGPVLLVDHDAATGDLGLLMITGGLP
jgi:hypothetical protein